LELFKNMAELDIVHIPYKGATPALTDLLGGHVSLMFANMLAALPHVKAGKLRALGVTSAKRSILAPDLPTIAEAGLPGFEVSSMYGVLVPVGTPKDIITKLNSQILGILHMPDVKEILSRQGAEVVGSTPEEFGVFIKEQIAKWAKVIKNAGIRIH
jgi:tripartite-type tricarboxylate transporter receptor subunit TctC